MNMAAAMPPPTPSPPSCLLSLRSVLRQRCDQFRARCDRGWADSSTDRVAVPDHFSREAVDAFLHYCYHGVHLWGCSWLQLLTFGWVGAGRGEGCPAHVPRCRRPPLTSDESAAHWLASPTMYPLCTHSHRKPHTLPRWPTAADSMQECVDPQEAVSVLHVALFYSCPRLVHLCELRLAQLLRAGGGSGGNGCERRGTRRNGNGKAPVAGDGAEVDEEGELEGEWDGAV